MRQAARNYKRLTWLVVAAMMFGACAPIFARVFEARQFTAWGDICGTAQHHVETSAPFSPSQDGKAALTIDRCPFCALLHHVPALPVKPTPWQAQSFWFGRLRRTRLVSRGQKRFRRRAHRSRAPPPSIPTSA